MTQGERPTSPIREINAVTLVAADLATSLQWYQVLGFTVVAGSSAEGFVTLAAGAGFLNLQFDAGYEPPVRVWGRVILWVDDVDAVHQRAVHAGMTPEGEPTDAPWGERYFHLRDPAGHELSFARPLP